MAREQRNFTTEFQREAVRLVENSGKGLTQVARDLGIAESTLSHCCKQLKEKGAEAFPVGGTRRLWKKRIGASSASWSRYAKSGTFLKKRSLSSREARYEVSDHDITGLGVSCQAAVCGAGGLRERLLRLEEAAARSACSGGYCLGRTD